MSDILQDIHHILNIDIGVLDSDINRVWLLAVFVSICGTLIDVWIHFEPIRRENQLTDLWIHNAECSGSNLSVENLNMDAISLQLKIGNLEHLNTSIRLLRVIDHWRIRLS